MAYNKTKMFEQAMKIIENDEDCVFANDVIAELPCCEKTFYVLFPTDSQEIQSLKEKLEANRTNLKRRLRRIWHQSKSASTQIALYKLLCIDTPEEARALNNQTVSLETHREMPLFKAIDLDIEKD